jgi:hypothetical protein
VITVTGFGEPVDKSYRKMISGMDLFERNRTMAPAASLRFKLLPRRKDTTMKRIDLEVVGEDVRDPGAIGGGQHVHSRPDPQGLG